MAKNIQAPSSDMEDLSRSNEAPCHSILIACRGELSVIENRIATIHQEITETDSKSALALRKEESTLKVYAETYRRILHPIRNFPVDVLREIFSACIRITHPDFMSSDFNYVFQDSLDTTQPPWSLGQVCHRWRQIVLDTPSFWTSLRVQLPQCEAVPQEKRYIARQLDMFLYRSRDLPLTVELKSKHSITPDDLIPFAFCSYSHRWERLRLTFPDTPYLHESLRNISFLIRLELPILHTLCLDLDVYSSETDAFEYAPNLRHLTIYGCSPDLHATLQIPWGQITHFHRLQRTTGYTRPSTSIEHLIQMPNIVEYIDMQFFCPPGPDVHLPHLESLALAFSDNLESDIALDRLRIGAKFTRFVASTSNCRDNCRDNEGLGERDKQALLSFIRRWSDNLRSLSLRSALLTNPECAEMLGYLDGLRSLSLYTNMSLSLYLCIMTAKPGGALEDELAQTSFLPQLRHLFFFGHSRLGESELVRSLEARLKGDTPLQTIGLPERLSAGSSKRLNAKGLAIRLTTREQWMAESYGNKCDIHM
ncbi:hypothetical protein VNI00_003031 [Paramarasmius palmivorus]|uniref:F-box domain-containing protein n=1 Tax=Paramarasmius palmivorus TaxID=297713 RepID=A0AAW0DVK7_9AGAR